MNEFFQRLKERKLVQWAVAYVAAAFALLQGIDIVAQQFGWPEGVRRGITLGLVIGFFVTLILAWYHGERGVQRVTGTELLIIGLVLALGGGFLWRFAAVSRGADTKTATPPNESRTSGAPVAIPEKSIAVLPFESLSEDKSNAYFADGIQDEILTRLAKVADLKVIARTSTVKYKSKPEDLRIVSQQLGVTNILEGSVQKVNDQVRVNVQLINAITNAHLWAEIYDRKLSDIFAVQSDIAKTVADTLQAKLTGAEKQMMAAQETTDTTAYELYHKGRSFWEKRSGDNIPKAIALYEQAVARDPNYALAYASLASAQILSSFYTNADRRESNSKAKEAALKALQLDPNLAEAHAALGKIFFWAELDITGAMREYKRAIELKPNDAFAHHWLGNDTLAALGRFEDAIAESKRAVELDPLSPIINTDLGVTFLYAGRYDDAVAQLRKTLAIDPTFFYAHFNLGILLQAKGDLSGAIAAYEKAKQLAGDNLLVLAARAAAKAQAGDKDTAQKMLSELDEMSKNREVLGYFRALLHLGLTNKDEALRWLEQGYEERDGANICWIKVDPLLLPLHGNPRFEALVQKVVAPKTQP